MELTEMGGSGSDQRKVVRTETRARGEREK